MMLAAIVALGLVACAEQDPNRAWERRMAPAIMTACEAQVRREVNLEGGTHHMSAVDRAAGLSSLVRGRGDIPHVMTLRVTAERDGRARVLRVQCLASLDDYRDVDLRIVGEVER